MNTLTYRAIRRERIRELFAAINSRVVAVLFCSAVILLLMFTVGGMEYADAVKMEGMR